MAHRKFGLLALAIVLTSAVLIYRFYPSAAGPGPGPGQRYALWRSDKAARVDAYLDFLRSNGVGEPVPPSELLRLGRRWRSCGGVEFALPARSQWQAMVPTLKLLGELRAKGLLKGAQVQSGYRPSAYNRCEGGSPGSRHLQNQALDLDLDPAAPDGIQTLCTLWRRRGPELQWGLGFYTPTRIHLDTAGFRTWGADFHRGSSLCHRSD